MSRHVPVTTENERPAWSGGLSDREYRWILEYLVDLNARQAALRCGLGRGNVKSATEIGSRFKRRLAATISEAIAEKSGIVGSAVLGELGAIAFSKITDYLKLEKGRLVLTVSDLNDLPDEAKAAIAKLRERMNEDGTVSIEVELHDKIPALKLLGSAAGAFVDRHEISGPNGGPVQFEDTAADVRARIKERLNALRKAQEAPPFAVIEPPLQRIAPPQAKEPPLVIDAEP